MPVYYWKLGLCRYVLEELHDEVLSAGRPSYDVILRLDAKLRNYPLPEPIRNPGPEAKSQANAGDALWIPRVLAASVKENSELGSLFWLLR
jgi:hypothetical protein